MLGEGGGKLQPERKLTGRTRKEIKINAKKNARRQQDSDIKRRKLTQHKKQRRKGGSKRRKEGRQMWDLRETKVQKEEQDAEEKMKKEIKTSGGGKD